MESNKKYAMHFKETKFYAKATQIKTDPHVAPVYRQLQFSFLHRVLYGVNVRTAFIELNVIFSICFVKL